jgi:3-methyladenine DNA glycosylase AlkD
MNSPLTATAIRRELRALANERDARILRWFFKTGPGEYGDGDRFIGVRVPQLRALVRAAGDVSLETAEALLCSPVHEERLFALLALVRAFDRGDDLMRERIYKLYLANTCYINNWDLVDSSAEYIVGAWLATRSRAPLRRLARSRSLWERRIAMLATFRYIKSGQHDDALAIAELLLGDKHDLIHKAVGWMLREVGKRCSVRVLKAFLRKHQTGMPRTALRYAIEHFPPAERRRYLARRAS